MQALILVDLQRDFLPGGALAVPDGDAVIPVANMLAPTFDLVVATRDWHPPNHGSFAANHPGREVGEVIELDGVSQVLWPMHCVQETEGAEFAAELTLNHIHHVVSKGTRTEVDSYSGFFDNGRRHTTGLARWLHRHAVEELFIMGLATDYCVKFTTLDALRLGFHTWLIEDGCRGVGLEPGDVDRALDEMRASGVHVVSSRELPGTSP